MRVAYPALTSLLLAGAMPAIALAQVLSLPAYPYPPRASSTLDHAVPVATVSLVGDIVTLDGARIVQDSSGEPFVLGAATLKLSVPSGPRIVFTMKNDTEVPIPFKDVLIYEREMVSAQYFRGATVGAPFTPASAVGWGPGGYPDGEQLQPGASAIVEVPLAPFDKTVPPSGFVVFVGRELPHADRSMDSAGRAWVGENPLFTRAFRALLSAAPRPTSSPF